MFAKLFLCLAVFLGASARAESSPPHPFRTEDLLSALKVAPEVSGGYNRKLFPHWSRTGGCTTRESVLRRDAVSKFPDRAPSESCKVVSGVWLSVYDNQTVYAASEMDVDHVVSLNEAWRSGARLWSPARRKKFANDLSDSRTLRAVTDDANSAKGDKDPANWLPSHPEAVCVYVSDWVSIKARWGLSVDVRELAALQSLLDGACAGQTTGRWSFP